MSLAPDQLRAFDSLRSRLGQLSETLSLIHRDLHARDPLPSWPQIETLQASLSFALSQLNETMALNADVLKEAHVYPLPGFPGHKEGDTLMALLRKKLDTKPEEWIEEFTTDFKGDVVDGQGLERSEMNELWGWASSCSQGIVGPMLENEDFGDDFTMAEREAGVENLRTGLRRKLWEDESGDEDDEGDKMEEDVMPGKDAVEREEGVDPERKPVPLDAVLRFATTGVMPQRPNR